VAARDALLTGLEAFSVAATHGAPTSRSQTC
jgi:hypothetical protein